MPSLHVDTNNGGAYRCATVIMYLHEVPPGCGGETRFPIATEPLDSPLREAGRQAMAMGATALFPDTSPAAAELLAAAECADTGVHIRPVRGMAAVFWTIGQTGLDASSWHNGARVQAHGGGKWIAQKFKEIPADLRNLQPLRLPDCLPPPPLPLPPSQPPPPLPPSKLPPSKLPSSPTAASHDSSAAGSNVDGSAGRETKADGDANHEGAPGWGVLLESAHLNHLLKPLCAAGEFQSGQATRS